MLDAQINRRARGMPTADGGEKLKLNFTRFADEKTALRIPFAALVISPFS